MSSHHGCWSDSIFQPRINKFHKEIIIYNGYSYNSIIFINYVYFALMSSI